MAVLTDPERIALWRRFMELGASPPTCTKTEVRAAIDAADSWIDTNAAAFNTALPQPFRGAATVAQKALILAMAALRRAGRDL